MGESCTFITSPDQSWDSGSPPRRAMTLGQVHLLRHGQFLAMRTAETRQLLALPAAVRWRLRALILWTPVDPAILALAPTNTDTMDWIDMLIYFTLDRKLLLFSVGHICFSSNQTIVANPISHVPGRASLGTSVKLPLTLGTWTPSQEFLESPSHFLVPQAVDERVEHRGDHGVEGRDHLVLLGGVVGLGPHVGDHGSAVEEGNHCHVRGAGSKGLPSTFSWAHTEHNYQNP